MPDLREVFQMSTQKVQPDRGFVERQEFRQRRRMRNRKIGAYAIVAAIIIAVSVVAIVEIRNGATSPVPADDPTPAEGLGIFAPVAGRIVYMAKGTWVVDRVEKGVWAVDPNGPSDTVEGPNVAKDVASSLVRLDLDEDALPPAGSGDGVEPLGWSSDGTELLVTRWVGFEGTFYVVHADGTETRVSKPSGVGARTAAISPDGSRVVFENEGLDVVDVEGGRAVKLPYPAGGEPTGEVTFSSDGTQIAYLAGDAVWVVNADGTDAHEILADEPALAKGVDSITWSPAGDRIAIGMGGAIYTFAPDGSDLTKVISGGANPHWSPDGSQIAFDGSAGLRIADADGSSVRTFGFAASGPWHPGE